MYDKKICYEYNHTTSPMKIVNKVENSFGEILWVSLTIQTYQRKLRKLTTWIKL